MHSDYQWSRAGVTPPGSMVPSDLTRPGAVGPSEEGYGYGGVGVSAMSVQQASADVDMARAGQAALSDIMSHAAIAEYRHQQPARMPKTWSHLPATQHATDALHG